MGSVLTFEEAQEHYEMNTITRRLRRGAKVAFFSKRETSRDAAWDTLWPPRGALPPTPLDAPINVRNPWRARHTKSLWCWWRP